jgi:putative oxidoreductase
MRFPQLAHLNDVSLLLMRLMIGVVFFTSGWKDLQDPRNRSKGVEMSVGFTIFLGLAECAGSLGVMTGVER